MIWRHIDSSDPKVRHADVVGEVVDALEAKQPAVVLAHPHAKASALIAAVGLTQGLIGVSEDRSERTATGLISDVVSDVIWGRHQERS